MSSNLSNLLVSPGEKIKDVLDRMAANKKNPGTPPGIMLVVDTKQVLKGIVTNGDIRRAFAAGIGVDDSISRAMNKNPSVITSDGRPDHILPFVFQKIKAGEWPKDRLEKILVVDEKHRVLDLVSLYDLVHKSDVRFKHVGVVGLGYVGLTLALTLADLGFNVKGYEVDKVVRDAIKRKKPHFYEQGLDALLKDHVGKNFRLVESFSGADNCDIYIIAVGTPLDEANKPRLSHLESAADFVGKFLKSGDIVMLRSTVPIGTTRNVVRPVLEKISGLKVGDDVLLAFAPERTVEGKALEELRTLPQVIGGINRASADAASSMFNILAKSTVVVDSLEEAEMVKLANNTYRDVMFGFANELSLVAQSWGIDTKKVIDAANYGYERGRIPMPSPGVGGYCLEKDPFIFIESAKAKGYEPGLARHARLVSDRMVDTVAENIKEFLRQRARRVPRQKVFILGFAFKGQPVTSDVRGSTAVTLVKKLQEAGHRNIHGFDPAARPEDITCHGVKCSSDIGKGFDRADAVVVMNNHPMFNGLDMRGLLERASKPVFLYDTWALYDSEEIKKVKGVEYRRL